MTDSTVQSNSGNKAQYLIRKGRTIFTFLLLNLLILFLGNINAQWVNVGPPGFTPTGIVEYPSLAISGSTPYVAFNDGAHGNKTSVMRFNGTNWEYVGSEGFSVSGSSHHSIAFDGITPYVAFMDAGNGNKSTVMKLDGLNWVNVGLPGFSAGPAGYQRLAIDNGTPYVAYKDFWYSYKITVMKFDGTSWVNVGSPGFSLGAVDFLSLVTNSGIPYVAYSDYGNSNRMTVKKFDGTGWVNVGVELVSGGSSDFPSLAFNNNGNLYVAFNDGINGDKTTVRKLNGGLWSDVGSPGFSVGSAYFQSLAFNGSTPYVAFTSASTSKITVMTFNGLDWVNVGAPGFSNGADRISLVMLGSSPYVAYSDHDIAGRLSVMKTFILKVFLKVVLEGFYNPASNLMVPDAMTVDIRSSVSPYSKLESATSLLNFSGQATFNFYNVTNGVDYYIALKHRNGIETWSKIPQQFNSDNLSYDFTTAKTQAFGDNLKQIDDSPVLFGIYSGDPNQDGVVDLSDVSLINNDALNYVSGIVPADLNGDEVVDVTDVLYGYNNSINFISAITP